MRHDPTAVKQTRSLVSDAVRTRDTQYPFPSPANYDTEEAFCEALLNTIFGEEPSN